MSNKSEICGYRQIAYFKLHELMLYTIPFEEAVKIYNTITHNYIFALLNKNTKNNITWHSCLNKLLDMNYSTRGKWAGMVQVLIYYGNLIFNPVLFHSGPARQYSQHVEIIQNM